MTSADHGPVSKLLSDLMFYLVNPLVTLVGNNISIAVGWEIDVQRLHTSFFIILKTIPKYVAIYLIT